MRTRLLVWGLYAYLLFQVGYNIHRLIVDFNWATVLVSIAWFVSCYFLYKAVRRLHRAIEP